MAYGIWCEVWGGVTGSRASWMKENGEIKLFYNRLTAQEVAHDLMKSIAGNPHRTANFNYTVREFRVD